MWNKKFITYITAMELTWIGYGLLRFALPLYLLQTTGNPALLGTVLAFSALPFIILSPIGGVFADRFNKRKMLGIINLTAAVSILAFIAVLNLLDIVSAVIILLLIVFSFDALGSPMMEASMPLLVPSGTLTKANSVTFLLTNFSTIGTPILGGFLIEHFGIMHVLFIATATYLLAGIIHPLAGTPHTPNKLSSNILKTIVIDLKDAVIFVTKKQPGFGKLLLKLTLFSMILSPITTVALSVLVTLYFNRGESILGVIQAIVVFGGTAGVLALKYLEKWVNIKNIHWLSFASAFLFLMTALYFVLSISDTVNFAIFIGTFFGLYAIATVFWIIMFAHIGETCPSDMLGKVMALSLSIMFIGIPMGEFLYGFLLHTFLATPYVALLIIAGMAVVIGGWSRSITT